jgi:murein DD-endopeptidase MepM/ murein hydrolase activator NlpD
VTYSDKSWNDVENKYDLLKSMELVIKEETFASDTTTNLSAKSGSKWTMRLLILAGFSAVIGNIPVQSHLLVDNTTTLATSFEIKTNSQLPTYSLASFEDNNHFIDSDVVDSLESPAVVEFELPERAIATYVGNVIDENKSKWVTYHVKSYDNPTNIFHKVGHQDLLKPFEKNPEIKKNIKALKKGSIVRANSNNGELTELIFTHGNNKSFVVTKQGDSYEGKWGKNVFETRQARTSFIIKNGLFFDGKRAGVANSVMKQFVKAFDWDIDFSHDVRVGDKVTAIFEELYHDGDKVGNQHLLAAEFINKGRQFRTIKYTYKDGKSDYFTPQGREMKKAFIRTPIEHARVSSHFNPRRFHPKLHKIRAHKGTDFSARRGTPIMATGNGTIVSIGRKGGYGKTVVIRHREGYRTTYAHMSKYKSGLKVGSKVYQSDVIGYVGSTGLATGPHLHYELHKAKKAVDPMRVKLPNSMSLNRKELKDFRNKAVSFVLQLNVLHRFVEADIEIDSVIGG